jgi:dihydrofolate reductase
MRKLKLQMNGTNLDWDNEMMDFCIANLKNVDCILLGRKTAEGFIPHWAGVAGNPKDSDYKLGKPLADIPKVVFSKKLKTHKWDNATIVKGEIVKEIKTLKKKKGKDIIVYGGYSFASSLIGHELIDEIYLLVNPLAGSGEPILKTLKNNLQFTLEKCKSFKCGTVLLHYEKN